MKSGLLATLLLTLAAVVLLTMMSNNSVPQAEIIEKRVELAIRKVGHELLLRSGDSSSRVLPVARLNETTWQLMFEKDLSFQTDTLNALTDRNLVAAGLSTDHIVEVIDRRSLEMIYGYERHPSYPIDLCRGRVHPGGNYAIQFTFTKPVASSNSYGIGFLAAALVVCAALVMFIKPKFSFSRNTSETQIVADETFTPQFQFDDLTGFVSINSKTIELTKKESKVLQVLVSNINQIVEREHLQNSVWTSEGVITGRSLDMFISKLRKKLEGEPEVRIVNIHGRGYRLEAVRP